MSSGILDRHICAIFEEPQTPRKIIHAYNSEKVGKYMTVITFKMKNTKKKKVTAKNMYYEA